MELYDYYRSTACYRVRIALHLKKIPYDTITINLVHEGGEHHHADYLSVNPQGLVPTLSNHGDCLHQSLAIIEYLDEQHPTPALLPTDSWDKAQVRSLALMIASDMHPLNNLRVLQQLRQQFNANEPQITEWYHHWLRLGFTAIEKKLTKLPRSKNVCYGEHITLADLCLIPQLYNAKRFHFPLDSYPLIGEINEFCLLNPAFITAKP
jgi:maleylacetoacetate isomerase